MSRERGTPSSASSVKFATVLVDDKSMTGLCPLTVTVSSIAPTAMVTSILERETDREAQLIANERTEARQPKRHPVGAGRQVREAISAVAFGDDDPFLRLQRRTRQRKL